MEVYLITNRINGKFYVGKTTRSSQWRLRSHFRQARFGTRTKLYNAIRKYGEEAFSITTLVYCDNLSELDQQETAWIEKLDAVRLGYNHSNGGHGKSGYKTSDSTKAKIRRALIGFRHSNETKRKMSESRRGKRLPSETIEKMRKAKIGKKRPYMKELLGRKVVQIDSLGNKIAEFDSQHDAAKALNVTASDIPKVVRGLRKTVHGFVFKWKEETSNVTT